MVIGKTNDRLKSVKLNPIVSCFYKAQLLKTAATFHLVREYKSKRGHNGPLFLFKKFLSHSPIILTLCPSLNVNYPI